ncbi:transketolase [Anaerobranca californiensis DSM 14826]|jgi:transketolase|uniref:Transketolase n=1 Tax=Anaerobranca californiensis DSM 14826 TaxID=1120989 RepID=A0A1M6PD23_9FIRM|nr:transketolase family protein [Anaerobranca californiensis]SHK05855.1 transketolase [Anaerobranca californiensis DSM 14826]
MTKIATRDAYGKALVQLGRENKDIVVLDADLSKSTKTASFYKEFPERFFNVGIAEADLMGTAAGLATAGKIPFASTFAIFATGRAYDQIRNSIAYPKLNVKIAATHAGLTVGEDGATHQALEDIALMRAIPNMTVIVPADGPETEGAIKAAAEINGPVYIRLGRSAVPVINDENYNFQIGKGVTLKEGNDVTIVATGIMVSQSLAAAEMLEKEGISVEVINIHTIKPIDKELLVKSAEKTGAVVTAEEHNIFGGLGSAVCEVLAQHRPVPVEFVGVEDTFGESGTPDALLQKYRLTPENIVEKVKKVMKRK